LDLNKMSTDPTTEEDAALTTISARDNQLSSLAENCSVLSEESLSSSTHLEVEESSDVHHDLSPAHNLLVQLAINLQVKVEKSARDLNVIRRRLATQMQTTAESLTALSDIKLPVNLSVTSPQTLAYSTILDIHNYRDQAVEALTSQVEILSKAGQEEDQRATQKTPEDFNTASDRLDHSFQQLRSWLDQIGGAAKKLQNCDGEPATASTLRRFSTEKCRDIDNLEREAVIEKMGELNIRNCSVQSRKPVRSLGHTLDLQEIMLLAKNAKSMVYEVSLQMLKIVDMVKGEEIDATTTYHRLTKENSELLRRYCFYLKLKIKQL